MDRILLKGMRFQARVGVTEQERKAPQSIEVDLELLLPLGAAGRSDEVKATVDYADAFTAVRTAVEQQPARLLEALAERIADAVQPLGAGEVVVRVRKLQPPLPGELAYAEVEVRR
jgi:dihydroneopterin aldolase